MKKISALNFRYLRNFIVNSLGQFNPSSNANFAEIRYDFRMGRAKIDCDFCCTCKYSLFDKIVALPILCTFIGRFDLADSNKSAVGVKLDINCNDADLYDLLEGQKFEPALLVSPFIEDFDKKLEISGSSDMIYLKQI